MSNFWDPSSQYLVSPTSLLSTILPAAKTVIVSKVADSMIFGVAQSLRNDARNSKTSASFEFIYFHGAGRGEPIRVMLHAAGVEFKDTRLEHRDWISIKPTTPIGTVPVLIIDDVQYCQSLALARYAAKLSGFYPDDPLDALVVDEVMDTCNDMMSSCPNPTDEEEKKRMRLQWQEGVLTTYSNLIESRIQAAGGSSVVKSPSIADLILKGVVVDTIKQGFFHYVDPNFYDNYPGILATTDAIMKNSKVKSYYDSIEK